MNLEPEPLELHIDIEEENQTPVDIMVKHASLTRHNIKEAMDKGALWLTRKKHTRRLRRVKSSLQAGDQLHLYYNQTILAETITPPTLIADEQVYSIWYKPYGVYCQGSKWGDHCTIHRWAEKALQRNAFIVHRLDRATSGLIIIAHKKSTATQFSELFAQRNIHKSYQAILHGIFPQQKITINKSLDEKSAISHIQRLNANNQFSLVEVTIETGRKHQIRRHLADLGFPIVGDRLYGKDNHSEENNIPDLQLCAHRLDFNCPINSELRSHQLSQQLTLKLCD